MANDLTRNLLNRIDVNGYDLVLVKSPKEKAAGILENKNAKILKSPDHNKLLVSTKKDIPVSIVKDNDSKVKKDKIPNKVVNSVRIGVEKSKKQVNNNFGKSKTVPLKSKNEVQSKVLISKKQTDDKDSASKIKIDNDDLKKNVKNVKVKSEKDSKKVDDVNVKLVSKGKSVSVVKKNANKVVAKNKAKVLLHDEHKEIDVNADKVGSNEKRKITDDKGIELSQNPNLHTTLIQGQNIVLQKTDSKNRVSNKSPIKSEWKHSTSLKVVANEKGVSYKSLNIEKGSKSPNKDFFSKNGSKPYAKDLVKSLESKFVKAMGFKRVMDKTRVKISSKTQRMQLTLGKTIQTSVHHNIQSQPLNVTTHSTNIENVAVSKNIDVQKPLSTNQNILQRFENVQKISNMIKSLTPQNKSMMMKLTPPNLGDVEVRLVTHGKEVLVNFIVKDADLKDVIKNSSQLLTTQLKLNTNYQKIQINVNAQDNQNQQQFHERDNNNQQNQNHQQRQYYQNDEEDETDDSQ